MKIPLTELITLQRGFDLPEKERTKGSIPVIASRGIAGWHNTAKVQGPGVVIGRSGSIGGGQYIVQDFWPLNTTLWVKEFNNHDPRYIYYTLKSINFERFNSGSGVPTLNRNHLEAVQVVKHEKDIERFIVKTLGSLDDKITLLRQQNETLEQIDQTLFKRWFVDFEFPISEDQAAAMGKPALAGKPYKSSGGKMVASELGEIPEGWRVEKIEQIAELNSSQLSKNYRIDEIDYIDTGSVSNGYINEIKKLKVEKAPSRAKRRVKNNSILYSVVRPIQRHYALLNNPQESWIASTGFCVIDPKIQPHYLYLILSQDSTIEYFESVANATASTYPTMRPGDIGDYKIVIPEENILNQFGSFAQNSWGKIDINQNEIQTLTQLRDTLLPKLMSGEIRVKME